MRNWTTWVALSAVLAGCGTSYTAEHRDECVQQRIAAEGSGRYLNHYSGTQEEGNAAADAWEAELQERWANPEPQVMVDRENSSVFHVAIMDYPDPGRRGWLTCHMGPDGRVRNHRPRGWRYDEGRIWEEATPGKWLDVSHGKMYGLVNKRYWVLNNPDTQGENRGWGEEWSRFIDRYPRP